MIKKIHNLSPNCPNRLSWINSTLGPTTNYAYVSPINDSYLQEIKNSKKSGVQTSRFGKYHDVVGNLTNWNRCFDGSSIIETQTPHYDDADRLVDLIRNVPGGVGTTWNYAYDQNGNRYYENTTKYPGGPDEKWHGVNLLDEVMWTNSVNPTAPDTSWGYDGNGNMIYSVVTFPALGTYIATYGWDAKNQLVSVSVPGIMRSEFTYDGLGRRIRIVDKDGSGVVTSDRYFVWEGMRIAEERAPGVVTPTKIYTPFGEIRGGVKYYYTKDHLGSLREVVDGNGNIVARYDYDPFGVTTQTLGTMKFDMLYTGHFYHRESSLYLAPYRAYNPALGRWISREPLGLDGPNLYHYVFNDPLKGVDPTGLRTWEIEMDSRFGHRQLVVERNGTYMMFDLMPVFNGTWRQAWNAGRVGFQVVNEDYLKDPKFKVSEKSIYDEDLMIGWLFQRYKKQDYPYRVPHSVCWSFTADAIWQGNKHSPYSSPWGSAW